ncbi:MAG: hypothetical protein CMH21_14675 [Methylophaga sp.]|nr:hypothetical protein [Methylophaga sp.]MAY18409.1 hypothetical protein [Methylophaga sp.]MAY18965.1 hypothetical protein [Methylophaga sp.]
MHFQPHPAGLGLFFRPTALEMNYEEQLHRIISALLDGKIASSSGGYERATSPSIKSIKNSDLERA